MGKLKYISNLTPLRGIAAVMMVIFHFNLMVMPIINPAITQMHRRWYLLVDFFFILSGFVIAYVYGAHFQEKVSKSDYFRYMKARFARVYPLHFFTLIWLILLYYILIFEYKIKLDGVVAMVFSVSEIPKHLLMLHGFNPYITGTWNTPSWSIGSEWLLYLLFPILALVISKIPKYLKFLLLFFSLGIYILITSPLKTGELFKPWLPHLPTMIDNIVFPNSLFRCFAGFLLGMLTLEAYYLQVLKNLLSKGLITLIVVILLAISYHFLLPDALTIWLFPLIILGAAYNQGRLSMFLNTKPLQRIGDWSYSIYMVHIPIMFSFLAFDIIKKQNAVPSPEKAIEYGMTGPIVCFVYLLIVLLVSFLSYRFLELPARKMINKKR